MWGVLSNEGTGLSFTTVAGPRQRIFGSESRGTRYHILLSQIPNFLFVASYGGGVQPCLHTGFMEGEGSSETL
jgi:hypothetical protein